MPNLRCLHQLEPAMLLARSAQHIPSMAVLGLALVITRSCIMISVCIHSDLRLGYNYEQANLE
jgi:hypothetical protein